MHKNLQYESMGFSMPKHSERRVVKTNYQGLLATERMSEVMMMCDRNNPVYEHVSSFSVALYTLGFFDCPDMMSFQDVSADEASEILKTHFVQINPDKVPYDYHIAESMERYLLVVGDPLFPKHFAVVSDMRSSRPYFSKLPFFGAGYDSLDELMDEFAGVDGVNRGDIHFFRKTWYGQIPPSSVGKIFIIKND